MITSIQRVVFSIILLALLVIGHDLTTHTSVSAQSAPSFLEWSADSRRLAVSIEAGALVIEEGRVISRCAVEGTVSALAFSPDGESLYVGTNEGGIMACNARTGRKPGLQQQTIPRPTRIARFDLSPDGSRFFVSSGTQSPDGLYLYDSSLTLQGQYDPFGFTVPRPQFLPDGTLVTFTREGDVLTVEQDGEPGTQITVAGPTQSLVFSSDGRYLLSATVERLLQVFDMKTGALLHTFDDVNSIYPVEGDYVMLSGMNGLYIYNLLTGEVISQAGWDGYNWSGAAVLILPTEGNQPSLFRMDTGEMIPLNVGRKSYLRLDFALDDTLLLFGITETGTDLITYPLSGTTLPTLKPLTQRLTDHLQIVGSHVFGYFDNQTVMVFDINTGALLHEHALTSFYPSAFLIRPDGDAYAVRDGQTLIIRTLEGEETVITLPG